MQDLANGHLDVKALGEAANGDENTIVTTRTGNTYPSAERAINIMFQNGGLPATPFTTKALMTASALIDGKYAQVTDDTVNNGLYLKTAGAWVKSAYDAVSKSQLVDELDSRAELSGGSSLLELEDVVGKLILFMQNNGELHIPNLSKSVQSTIKDLTVDVDDINHFVSRDNSDTLVTLLDDAGVFVGAITDNGTLIINDVLTKSGSIDTRLSDLESNVVSDTNTEILKATDYAIAARDGSPLNVATTIATASEWQASQIKTPLLLRVGKSKYMLFSSADTGGDFASTATVFYYVLTVNADYSVTKSAPTVFLEGGVDESGSFTRISAAPLLVETGIHTGRLYIYYIKRYGTIKDETWYKYSDDMGVSWSDEMPMTPYLPNMEQWRLVATGPATGVQIKNGENAGRLVIPCWHATPEYPNSQIGLTSFLLLSDDGGETYYVGASSTNAGSNECDVVEFGENGELMLLTRNATTSKTREVSYDGGITLKDKKTIDSIETAKIQSCLLSTRNSYDISVPKIIVSTPSSGTTRNDMTIFISYDNGKTFDLKKKVNVGSASYSAIEVVDESHLIVAYEGFGLKRIEVNIINLKSIILGE